MSPNDKEQQLEKEALIAFPIKTTKVVGALGTIDTNSDLRWAFKKGAESEAAKQYHSSGEVDLDELGSMIWALIPRKCEDNLHATEVVNSILDTIKPYLHQPTEQKEEIAKLKALHISETTRADLLQQQLSELQGKMENKTIEFCNWIRKNNWEYSVSNRVDCWFRNMSKYITSEELYKEFLKSKEVNNGK